MSLLKRFFRRLFIFIFRLGLIVGVVGLIGFVIWSEISYRNSLTFLPQNAQPNAMEHQSRILHAQWVALGGIGDIPSGTLFPTHTFMRIAYHTVNRTPPKQVPPTDRVTLQTARLLLARHDKHLSQKKWHQAMAASAGWIHQNWSMKQRLNTILAESRSGLGCKGIEKTARRLFGKASHKLPLEKIALLVTIQVLPFPYLKRSQRVLDKTNRVMRRLKRNYPVLYQDTKPLTRLPFSIGTLERARLACRRG